MTDLSSFAKLDFEQREDYIKVGNEPRAEKPTLVEVDISGLAPVALKWFGGREGEEAKEQFFFSVFSPNIPEWEMIGLSEWCVVGVGKWEAMKSQFLRATPMTCEPQDWVVVIAVNHSLTDMKGRDMFGRPYFAILATRLIGGDDEPQHIVPKEFRGEVEFRPLGGF